MLACEPCETFMQKKHGRLSTHSHHEGNIYLYHNLNMTQKMKQSNNPKFIGSTHYKASDILLSVYIQSSKVNDTTLSSQPTAIIAINTSWRLWLILHHMNCTVVFTECTTLCTGGCLCAMCVVVDRNYMLFIQQLHCTTIIKKQCKVQVNNLEFSNQKQLDSFSFPLSRLNETL